jgi:dihydrofolate reductase
MLSLVSSDAVAFVSDLKSKPGKGICIMGGGLLAKALLEANLIDEIGLNIHPVILGSGIPLFHEMKQRIHLELIENRLLENGCIYAFYRVKH